MRLLGFVDLTDRSLHATSASWASPPAPPGCPVLSSGLGISMRALPPALGLRSHASRRPQPGPRSCSLGHPSRPWPCHSAPSLLFPPHDDFTHGLTNLLADGASPPTVPHLLAPLLTPGPESCPSRPGGISALPRCLLQEGPTLRMWEASCASVPCRALTPQVCCRASPAKWWG